MTLKQSADLDHPPAAAPTEPPAASGSQALAWSSLAFATLQSICGAVVAINGLRLAIGIGSLTLASGAGAAIVRFHSDWIRIPMILFAVIGAVANLAIFFHVRYLRSRPASQWRQRPPTPKKLRMEYLQLVLSLATFILVAFEEYLHFQFHHHL